MEKRIYSKNILEYIVNRLVEYHDINDIKIDSIINDKVTISYINYVEIGEEYIRACDIGSLYTTSNIPIRVHNYRKDNHSVVISLSLLNKIKYYEDIYNEKDKLKRQCDKIVYNCLIHEEIGFNISFYEESFKQPKFKSKSHCKIAEKAVKEYLLEEKNINEKYNLKEINSVLYDFLDKHIKITEK